ncbi:hypothetical protein [Rhizobium sp. MHM7A]|uniref:hypothetical protein n=1 Tax=Rhizobium sp. MHM7A TaxID=2583233 RepID=UPI001106E04A|nr:hypothetical protein [Rhizobium sp. MHM7A]TLX12142.1 hypothetical protein FFR93_16375 [Rhizobium sp. MHM7A]
MTTIKNVTNAPVSIGSMTIRPQSSASTDRWHILKHSDNARALLAAKAIEVTENAKADTAPKVERKASK